MDGLMKKTKEGWKETDFIIDHFQLFNLCERRIYMTCGGNCWSGAER